MTQFLASLQLHNFVASLELLEMLQSSEFSKCSCDRMYSRPEAYCAAVVNVQRIEHKLLHLLCLPVEEVVSRNRLSQNYPISPKSFSE